MKITIFKTPEEQGTGLLNHAQIPKDTLFLFPNIQSYILTTVGMAQPIRVALLDKYMSFVPIGFYLEAVIESGRTLVLPAAARHAIEANENVSIMGALANTKLWRELKMSTAGDH